MNNLEQFRPRFFSVGRSDIGGFSSFTKLGVPRFAQLYLSSIAPTERQCYRQRCYILSQFTSNNQLLEAKDAEATNMKL